MLTQLFRSNIIKLKTSDFDFSNGAVRIKNKRAIEQGGLVAFQMAWCHYCRDNTVVLNILAQQIGRTKAIMTLDGVDHPQVMDQLKARGLINGFPTVYIVHKSGVLGKKYTGPRTVAGYKRAFA